MRLFFLRFYLLYKYWKKGLTVSPFEILETLEKSQYWSEPQIENHQLKNINNLIEQCVESVDYYKSASYKGKTNFLKLSLFSQIFPVLNKDEIRNNHKCFLNHQIAKRIPHFTSGSTGKPLKIEISPLAESYRVANNMRFFSWWDINYYDKNILIWRVSKFKGIYGFLKRLENRLLGRLKLDVFGLNENSIYDYFDQIEKFKPKYLRGYKSGILELAELMAKFDLKFILSRPVLVVVTSEILLESERLYMEKVFQCKVVNEYGAADSGQFAYECPEGSLHINEESVFLSTNEDYELHVTEIFNNGMPLLNFKNEDRLIFSNNICPCGRKLKIIESIEGRVTDYIICKNGDKKHSLIFVGIFNEIEKKFKESILQFKVIQDRNNLTIEIIKGPSYKSKVKVLIKNLVMKEICMDLDIEIKVVDKIERDKSGKLKYFIKIR